jgi:hypothetical protein
VAVTLLVELPATLLLVTPSHTARLWGAGLQALLQLMIIATGNYNFFNLLTLVLLIPVCERDNGCDKWQKSEGNHDSRRARMPIIGFQTVLVYLFLAFSCWTMFDMAHVVTPEVGDRDDDSYSWLEQVQVQVRPDFDLQGWLTPLSIAGFGTCVDVCF